MMSVRRRAELLACRAVPRPGEIHSVSPLVIEYQSGSTTYMATLGTLGGCNEHSGMNLLHVGTATDENGNATSRVIYPAPSDISWCFVLFKNVAWHRSDLNAGPLIISARGAVTVLVTGVSCMRGSDMVIVRCLLPSGIAGWAVWASVFTTWRRIV